MDEISVFTVEGLGFRYKALWLRAYRLGYTVYRLWCRVKG
jgi:hypothetical protein